MPTRRLLLQSLAAVALTARDAHAQAYPAKPVRLIVGYAAGGATDITARLIAQQLSMRMGQPFVVDNRPGAATNIATREVIRAAADGHTLLVATAANAINATLYDKLDFRFVDDMAAVGAIIAMQNVLEVHPAVPVRSVAELIAYAKANPDRLSYGSAGIGSPGHVSAELFKMLTGVRMQHVPYRGVAPALADLIGGQIQVMFDNMATAIDQIRAGTVRPLGITTAARSRLLPDLPTIAETVPGYDASSWYGLAAPRGTPAPVVAALNHALNASLVEPAIVQAFDKLGGAPMPGTPAAFQSFIADETEKWGRVIRFAGVKPE